MGKECCDETNCCRSEAQECCSESCGEEKSHSAMILEFANDAWAELMKEKMKAAYEEAVGEKMSKVAKIGVEACMAYWQNKMRSEAASAEFEEKLAKAMSE